MRRPATTAYSDDDRAILGAIRSLRRRLAPEESRRERLLRAIYAPIVGRLAAQARARAHDDEGGLMVPEIVQFGGRATQRSQRAPADRIVVLKLDHTGDFIIGMRALQSIREGFPDAHITLVCASWNEPFAQTLGWFDRIVTFNFFTELNRDWSGPMKNLYGSVNALPLGAYDLAIDLRYDADTRPCLYRIDAATRAGFAAPAEAGLPWLDLSVPLLEESPIVGDCSDSMHAELRLELLAATVVAAFGTTVRPHPVAALLRTPASAEFHRYAVLAIGAGDPIRCWPIARYAEVGRSLMTRHDLDIVVLGGAADQADAATLAAALPPGRVELAVGRPFAEVPRLLADAALCICNGSGVSHLAAALGVATVCVLGGASRMSVWHPAGPRAISVGGMTPCQPCGFRRADQCPWDVACLHAVSPVHVLDICEHLLEPIGSPPG